LKKIFFDTDVILDVSIERDIDIKDSVKIINLIESGFAQGCTSSIIFSNIYSQWGFLPPLGAVEVCVATDMPVENPTVQ
jgi:hypothetical protein